MRHKEPRITLLTAGNLQIPVLRQSLRRDGYTITGLAYSKVGSVHHVMDSSWLGTHPLNPQGEQVDEDQVKDLPLPDLWQSVSDILALALWDDFVVLGLELGFTSIPMKAKEREKWEWHREFQAALVNQAQTSVYHVFPGCVVMDIQTQGEVPDVVNYLRYDPLARKMDMKELVR